MSDKHFLDTNVFVYSFDDLNPSKQAKAIQLIKTALDSRQGCISYQVIQEFLNVATRKFIKPLSFSDSKKYISTVLEPLCEIYSSIGLYYQALEIAERWQYSFYDSLIISAALSANCSILYSEDMQDGQTIEELTIRNPFFEKP